MTVLKTRCRSRNFNLETLITAFVFLFISINAIIWLWCLVWSFPEDASYPDGFLQCPADQSYKVVDESNKTVKCTPCPVCPEGEQPTPPCGNAVVLGAPMSCTPCQSETYSNGIGSGACTPCTTCGLRDTIRPCTRNSDTECGDCPRGYYKSHVDFSCKYCFFCCEKKPFPDIRCNFLRQCRGTNCSESRKSESNLHLMSGELVGKPNPSTAFSDQSLTFEENNSRNGGALYFIIKPKKKRSRFKRESNTDIKKDDVSFLSTNKTKDPEDGTIDHANISETVSRSTHNMSEKNSQAGVTGDKHNNSSIIRPIKSPPMTADNEEKKQPQANKSSTSPAPAAHATTPTSVHMVTTSNPLDSKLKEIIRQNNFLLALGGTILGLLAVAFIACVVHRRRSGSGELNSRLTSDTWAKYVNLQGGEDRELLMYSSMSTFPDFEFQEEISDVNGNEHSVNYTPSSDTVMGSGDFENLSLCDLHPDLENMVIKRLDVRRRPERLYGWQKVGREFEIDSTDLNYLETAYIRDVGSPTKELFDILNSQGRTVSDLLAVLHKVNCHDVAVLIRRHITQS